MVQNGLLRCPEETMKWLSAGVVMMSALVFHLAKGEVGLLRLGLCHVASFLKREYRLFLVIIT